MRWGAREGDGTPLQYSCLEKSHGWKSLVGYSPWGCKESDTTEQLPFHFSLSCIGEGNGNPLQCSCLENPRDGGAWWAADCGVAESDTPEATQQQQQQQQQRQQRQQWWGATKQIGKTKSGPSMTSHLQSTGSRRLEYTYLPLKISVPLIQQPGNLFMYRMSVISFNGCYSQKSTYKSPRNYIKGSHCWLHSLNLLCKGVFC